MWVLKGFLILMLSKFLDSSWMLLNSFHQQAFCGKLLKSMTYFIIISINQIKIKILRIISILLCLDYPKPILYLFYRKIERTSNTFPKCANSLSWFGNFEPPLVTKFPRQLLLLLLSSLKEIRPATMSTSSCWLETRRILAIPKTQSLTQNRHQRSCHVLIDGTPKASSKVLSILSHLGTFFYWPVDCTGFDQTTSQLHPRYFTTHNRISTRVLHLWQPVIMIRSDERAAQTSSGEIGQLVFCEAILFVWKLIFT